MSGRKTFVAGEVLQAADVNDFLMDQSVMVFAGTAARGSAIPSPSEGMVTYLSDSDEVQVYDGSVFKAVGPGKILQVVQAFKNDVFSSSSATYVDITGLSASITPSSSSNKIMVSVKLSVSQSSGNNIDLNLLRDAVSIGLADGKDYYATSSPSAVSGGTYAVGPAEETAFGFQNIDLLDAPASTSALTYKVQVKAAGGTNYVNRTRSAAGDLSVSSITLMEVAG